MAASARDAQAILRGIETTYRRAMRAIEGLDDKQFKFHANNANTPIWLVFRNARYWDELTTRLGSAIGVPMVEVWVNDGWADSFGIAKDRTGMGDTHEVAQAFWVAPSRLVVYFLTCKTKTLYFVEGLSPEQLDTAAPTHRGELRTVRDQLMDAIVNCSMYAGMLSMLRGMIQPHWNDPPQEGVPTFQIAAGGPDRDPTGGH